jgi:hypothetical protein
MKSNSIRRVARTGPASAKNVVVQPLRQQPDVAGQPKRLGFVPPRERQFREKAAVVTAMAAAIDPGLQFYAPRRRAFGETRERVGQDRASAQNVKHVAVARRPIAPRGLLPGAQALPGIGDRAVGLQLPCAGIEQIHAPGVRVAMLRGREKIAIHRRGIDAGQNRCRALKDLVMQAHANAGQILAFVDDARPPRDKLKQVVNGAQTDGHAQQIADEFDRATV